VGSILEPLDISKVKNKKSPPKTDEGVAAAGGAGFDPTFKRTEISERRPKMNLTQRLLKPNSSQRGKKRIRDSRALPVRPWRIRATSLALAFGCSTVGFTYPLLLAGFFVLLWSQHPGLTGDGRRSFQNFNWVLVNPLIAAKDWSPGVNFSQSNWGAFRR
jgi:hypothetical protein